MNFLVTEYGWLNTDLQKYGFYTSLEQKQKAALGDNFYGYLEFCKKALPEGAQVKMITSDPTNFYNTKAMYYLYPVSFVSNEPKYLLVYMYNKDLELAIAENRGYRLLKRYDEGAYILWKK